MVRLTAMDELFVHQLPEPHPVTVHAHPHWRESYFFELHDAAAGAEGDVVFFTMATYPTQDRVDSLQMGRVGGRQVLGHLQRPADGDPHTTAVPGATIEVVEAFREIRLFADPAVAGIGIDLTYRARTQPYGLRRGTLVERGEVIWDQSHMLQSGTYHGTYTFEGAVREVDGWIGQRDHSWGVRDHGRCPLWIWFQIQLDDGFLGIWHWERRNGSRLYTDGCWAPADGGEPIPVVDFRYGSVGWTGADGRPVAYGTNGDDVAGLAGRIEVVLEGGRTIAVEAAGTFARPYEPFHRGGLNLVDVVVDDGRRGTAIYEVTGAQHHHFFPDTEPPAPVP